MAHVNDHTATTAHAETPYIDFIIKVDEMIELAESAGNAYRAHMDRKRAGVCPPICGTHECQHADAERDIRRKLARARMEVLAIRAARR